MIISSMERLIYIINLFVLCKSAFVFCQDYGSEVNGLDYFLNNRECFSTTIYSPNESDLFVAFHKENVSIADKNTNHYYVRASDKENIIFLNILDEYDILDNTYVFNDDNAVDGDYKELNNGKLIDTNNIELIFQFDLSSPCHNDSFFCLITSKKVARDLLIQLSNTFEENDGFKNLIKDINKK